MAGQLLLSVAVVFIQVLLDYVAGGKCPLGFMGHGNSCYYFSHTKATFWEAEKICRHFDGYLTQVTTQEENDFIRNFAITHGKASNYWLGGTDLRVEGTWTWEHKMRKFNYSNWSPGQPNNGRKGKEHCLEISKELSYMWNDNMCDLPGHFICEQDTRSVNGLELIVDMVKKQQKKTESKLEDLLLLTKSFFKKQKKQEKALSELSGQIQQINASLQVEHKTFEDCQTIQNKLPNSVDGVYRLKLLDGKGSFQVFCDMSKHDGGWVVIQRNYRGSEDFYRTWDEYKEGFGELTGEFWLGNEKIHRLTKQKRYQLRIDLEMMTGTKLYALYNTFSLSGKSKFYTLHIGGYSGTTGDKMAYHNNLPFSAKDKDLDPHTVNCAVAQGGAWWYNKCYNLNLNSETQFSLYSNKHERIRSSIMKIRPLG